MTKTCLVAGCKTNYKQKVDGVVTIPSPGTVFIFPDKDKKPELHREWVRFCNQKNDFKITGNNGICEKHFDNKLIKDGVRKTLHWNRDPAPTNYSISVPPSTLPTPKTHRKPPTNRTSPDELLDFQKDDSIRNFGDLTDNLCPDGYKLELHEAPCRFRH